MDGLKAVNVYVVESGDGLTLIDGGWAIPVARELLERCLREVGYGFGDISRFLVTHVHRDHYTMASVLGAEHGAHVSLGAGEKPALDLLNDPDLEESPFLAVLRTAGAQDIAEEWNVGDGERPDLDLGLWRYPDTWLDGDHDIDLGTRSVRAVHTPGHTPGHFVFAETGAGMLFAGDHVLPTITPSIGFTVPPADQPLGDFMASLAKVRALPDLQLLPAHGPVAPSTHARVDELLEHHEERLAASLAALATGPRTARQVAAELPWTRHEHQFETLDGFSRGMAAMETKAHLDLLVARGQATATVSEDPDGVRFTAVPS
nr:MBL fold metallo-hydrolase [Nocardioides sp. zg-DK7169]